eukprot:sb/3473420/
MGVQLVEGPCWGASQHAVSQQQNLWVGTTGVQLAGGLLHWLADGRNSGDYPVQPPDHFGTKYVHAPTSEKNLFHFKVFKWLSFPHFTDYRPKFGLILCAKRFTTCEINFQAIRHHTHSQRRLFWVAFPALKTAYFGEPNRKNARFDPIVSR